MSSSLDSESVHSDSMSNFQSSSSVAHESIRDVMDLTSESNNYQNYATQVRCFFISRDLISLGDVIDLGSDFDLNHDQIDFFYLNLKRDFYSSLRNRLKSVQIISTSLKLIKRDKKND